MSWAIACLSVLSKWRTATSTPSKAMAMLVQIAVILTACADHKTTADTQRVVLGDQTFELELALDRKARFKGLSDRPKISADGGMLFVFPQPRRLEFVMRRCLVPIDLIFLDPGGRIVGTHAMSVQPFDTPEERLRRYTSGYPAQFAIELKGGTTARLRLEPGAKIDLPLDALKRRAR